MRRAYSIFADYHQFYLWDMGVAPQAPTDFTDEDVARRIKAAPNIVVIQPARNMVVPVELNIEDGEPALEGGAWDHVVEASLELPTGQLEIHECTGQSVDRLVLKPGAYRVRAYFGRLAEISDDGLDGQDHYKLVLWAAPYGPVSVLKEFQPNG